MIVIYGHERCIWCKKAKRLADRYSIKTEWKDTDIPEVLAELKEKVRDLKTVPQIWMNGIYLGGYDNLTKEIENTLGNYGQETF